MTGVARRNCRAVTFGLVAAAGMLVLASRRESRRGSIDDGRVLDVSGVRKLYDRIAPIYDLAAWPYNAVRARRLSERAIVELRLEPGDTVVDLGTGTGWNLPRLADVVGPNGRVIGVDISSGMLERARRRVDERSVGNVELVEADLSTYRPPPETKAVVSTFAMEMRPDYADIIHRLSNEIANDARIATTGLRNPQRWPEWLIWFGTNLVRVFGVSNAYRDHRPWEAIADCTGDSLYVESHAGVIYLAAGTVRDHTSHRAGPGTVSRTADSKPEKQTVHPARTADRAIGSDRSP